MTPFLISYVNGVYKDDEGLFHLVGNRLNGTIVMYYCGKVVPEQVKDHRVVLQVKVPRKSLIKKRMQRILKEVYCEEQQKAYKERVAIAQEEEL